jgi:hypothetical protein
MPEDPGNALGNDAPSGNVILLDDSASNILASIGTRTEARVRNVEFQRYCAAVGRPGALQISKTPVAEC